MKQQMMGAAVATTPTILTGQMLNQLCQNIEGKKNYRRLKAVIMNSTITNVFIACLNVVARKVILLLSTIYGTE